MARTRTQLRQMTVDQLEVPQITGTAESSGSGASSLVDKDLQRFSDNELIGAWLYLTSGSPTYKDVRITDNVQSSGEATFRPAQISGAPDNLTYEILPYESSAIHTAINEAMDELYDSGILVKNMWMNHWLTGSPIYNSTFDYWTSDSRVDGWTPTGGAVNKLSTMGYSLSGGAYGEGDHIVPSQTAVRLSAPTGGADDAYLELDNKYAQFLQDLTGDSITIRAWVRTSTASNSRAQLKVDDVIVSSTSYHSGDGQWELVSSDGYNVANTATKITVQLHNASAQGDFGAVWIEGGTRIREYPFPIGMAPDGPDAIFSYPVNVQEGNNNSTISARRMSSVRFGFNRYHTSHRQTSGISGVDEMGVIELQSRPTARQVLRMPISIPLTLPEQDSDAVEVTRIDSLLICKMAAAKLLVKDMMHGPSTFRQRASERSAILMQEIRQIAEGRGATASDTAPLSPTW